MAFESRCILVRKSCTYEGFVVIAYLYCFILVVPFAVNHLVKNLHLRCTVSIMYQNRTKYFVVTFVVTGIRKNVC